MLRKPARGGVRPWTERSQAKSRRRPPLQPKVVEGEPLPLHEPIPFRSEPLEPIVNAELTEAEGEAADNLVGSVGDGLLIDPTKPVNGRPFVLTADDMMLIWRLHSKGLSVRSIERICSSKSRPISVATINRFIRRVSDKPEDLQIALKGLRREAVDAWRKAMHRGAKDGKHAPAKDLLIATGIVRQDSPADRVVIIVGDGSASVARLPQAPLVIPGEVIDVEAKPIDNDGE